jgi:7-cyano-7-deazaguanine synthase in queuosine biosynthesis
MTTKPLAVVLASGGLDSCVAAAVARREFALAHVAMPITASAAVEQELEAFRAQAAFFEADLPPWRWTCQLPGR